MLVKTPKRIVVSLEEKSSPNHSRNGLDRDRTGGVVGGSRAAGSVTHSPDSPLSERRTGLGGPTTLGCAGATHGATRPVSVGAAHE